MADTSSPGAAPASPPPAATSPAPIDSPAVAAVAPAPANTGILEADNDLDAEDADSLHGAPSEGSDTTSVASYVFRHREENGRTYHGYRGPTENKEYFMPNDEREVDRLDTQHYLVTATQDNQLFVCPGAKERPLRRVLDAGCGTGVWAMEFADEYPETAVVGVDLSPIQPSSVPPNAEFFVDDLEAEWNYETPFDFIYGRFLTAALKDWPRFFRQAFENTRPGGYIEMCDIVIPLTCDDGTLPEDSAVQRWHTLLSEATHKLGVGGNSVQHYKQQMIDAGYQNVTQVEYKWPMNSWPKDKKYKQLGAWVCENMNQALQALSLMAFTHGLGWSAAETELLLMEVRKDFKNRSMHAYWPIWVVYGQKPE